MKWSGPSEKKVTDTNKAAEVYLGQGEDRILLSIGQDLIPNKTPLAVHMRAGDNFFIIVNEGFFAKNTPASAYNKIIHEASHATGADDYFYYYSFDYIDDAAKGNNVKDINNYIKERVQSAENGIIEGLPPGPHLPEKLGLPPDTDPLVLASEFQKNLTG